MRQSMIILAPHSVKVEFAVDPVFSLLVGLYGLSFADSVQELDPWFRQVAAQLPTERAHANRVVCEGLQLGFAPGELWASVEAFLAHLEEINPGELRARILQRFYDPQRRRAWQEFNDFALPAQEEFLSLVLGDCDDHPNLPFVLEAHQLLAQPERLKELVVSHLRWAWSARFEAEWEKHRAGLESAAHTLAAGDYTGKSPSEIVSAVTGREIRGKRDLEEILENAERLLFSACPHLGQVAFFDPHGTSVHVMFSPQEVHRRIEAAVSGSFPETASPPLARADLLGLLNTLADDTRLRILELLAQHGPLGAPEIIDRLQVNQPSVSRHLGRLSAAGFIKEQRGMGKTKYYAINPNRLHETLQALARISGAEA